MGNLKSSQKWEKIHYFQKNNNTIKPQLAKFSEAFNLPWTKALSLVLLNLR